MKVDDSALRKHFSHFGGVLEATVVTNTHTGKSKGYGFVEFADAFGCVKALADTKGHKLASKWVDVKPRQPKGSSGERAKGEKGKGSSCEKGKGGKGGKGGKSE